MVEYLDKFKLFSNTQYGFRKNKGTENALMNYIDLIQKELNNKNFTISVFLDLSTVIRGVKGLRGVKGQFFIFVLTDSIII